MSEKWSHDPSHDLQFSAARLTTEEKNIRRWSLKAAFNLKEAVPWINYCLLITAKDLANVLTSISIDESHKKYETSQGFPKCPILSPHSRAVPPARPRFGSEYKLAESRSVCVRVGGLYSSRKCFCREGREMRRRGGWWGPPVEQKPEGCERRQLGSATNTLAHTAAIVPATPTCRRSESFIFPHAVN